MRIGAFKINEPLPELYKPHAFVILRPWIDAGGVGSLTINLLEDTFGAHPMGELSKPGSFFDFTRYRPTIKLVDGKREVDIPNSYIFFTTQSKNNNLVFFHLLEPHMAGEYYAESVLKVLQALGINRYCLIGSMYDSVPHTKPLLVSGNASSTLMEELQKLDVQRTNYEGPTTINILTSQEAQNYNIEVVSLIVHLPQYAQLEEDFSGQLRLLEVICSLYKFPIDLAPLKHKASLQNEKLDQAMKREKHLEQLVQELEILYEARSDSIDDDTERFSPEIAKFLSEIDKGF
jgi:predicted ATP-grasp superfamily ATP-dependent carboligase